MIKHAYQLGFQKALDDGNAEQLLKEAMEMGVDLEKLAFWGSLVTGLKTMASGAGKYLRAGRGAFGAGARAAAKGGAGRLGQFGAGLQRAGSAMGKSLGRSWGSLGPAQQQAMKLTGAGVGGVGIGATGASMFGGENPGTSNSQFGY